MKLVHMLYSSGEKEPLQIFLTDLHSRIDALRPNKHSSNDAGCGLRLSNKSTSCQEKKPTNFFIKVWAESVMTPSANNYR